MCGRLVRKVNLQTFDRSRRLILSYFSLANYQLTLLQFDFTSEEAEKPLQAIFIAIACVTAKQKHKQKRKKLAVGRQEFHVTVTPVALQRKSVSCGSARSTFPSASHPFSAFARQKRERRRHMEANPFAASRSLNDMQTLFCDSFPPPI